MNFWTRLNSAQDIAYKIRAERKNLEKSLNFIDFSRARPNGCFENIWKLLQMYLSYNIHDLYAYLYILTEPWTCEGNFVFRNSITWEMLLKKIIQKYLNKVISNCSMLHHLHVVDDVAKMIYSHLPCITSFGMKVFVGTSIQ